MWVALMELILVPISIVCERIAHIYVLRGKGEIGTDYSFEEHTILHLNEQHNVFSSFHRFVSRNLVL